MPANQINPPVYRLLGGPGSPYSLKMRAVLRYRRIAHHWIVPRGYLGAEGELREANKRIIPVLQYPEGDYRADSTPLIYDLERRHPDQRPIIPEDPALAFLAHLIEDMADEMLVTAMFDLRWGSPQDQQFCALRQLSGWLSPLPGAELAQLVARFTARQTTARARLVEGDNHAILMALYRGVLDAMESMLDHSAFLFGSRPSLADFGLYGQLCQCAIDPSASTIMRAAAPRTFQWTHSIDDASGVDGAWFARGEWSPAVPALLTLVGRYYLPLLNAHYAAVESGSERFQTEIAGYQWQGVPERYKHKCWIWLQREWEALPGEARDWLRPVLEASGCRAPWGEAPPPRVPVPEMAPL